MRLLHLLSGKNCYRQQPFAWRQWRFRRIAPSTPWTGYRHITRPPSPSAILTVSNYHNQSLILLWNYLGVIIGHTWHLHHNTKTRGSKPGVPITRTCILRGPLVSACRPPGCRCTFGFKVLLVVALRLKRVAVSMEGDVQHTSPENTNVLKVTYSIRHQKTQMYWRWRTAYVSRQTLMYWR
jgi:hypothetical protein